MSKELLSCINLTKIFGKGWIKRTYIKAVDDVTISLEEGKFYSLVGQSGSGKTTLAKMILRLLEPTSGKIVFMGRDVWRDIVSDKDLNWYWRNVHAIFQDPYASFNPFYKVDRTLHQALHLVGVDPNSVEGQNLIQNTLEKVGLRPDNILGKYPHQLSGGQLQRILIARSLIIKPKLLIADEPVSMLDASTRGKIMELLDGLKRELQTTILFITHDLGIAYAVSDEILVMYQGKILERGKPEEIIENPRHEYTKKLIESVPSLYKKWSDFT